MNLQSQDPFLGGWLTDAGNILGKSARGILDIAGKAVNVVTTRGGADQDVIVREQQAPQSSMNDLALPLAIGGVGILALVAVMAGKPKRRRR